MRRSSDMRRLLASLVLVAACDPVWKIESAATASASTRLDAACIDAGLRAWKGTFEEAGSNAPGQHNWFVGAPPYQMYMRWQETKPGTIELLMRGMGGRAGEDTVTAYRAQRDGLLEKLAETCGPFEALPPDRCTRADC